MDAGTDFARRLHAAMLRIRRVEEAIAEYYPRGEMRCPVHLSIGQEAAAVGVCEALRREDPVTSGHRCHAHYLAKGGDLRAMLAELHGRSGGCAGGKGGSMHLTDPAAGFLGAAAIVASSIPIAVGAAFAASLRGEDRVAAAFFGDGAVEEGLFAESLNFAAVRRLPVLFVCENNLYSVYSPLSVRQPEGREIAAMARGLGVEAVAEDGNDVLRVHRAATEAVRRARSGGGPAFLELRTYRWLDHCGPGEDHRLGYRSEAEVAAWKKCCPIRRLEERLLAEAALTRLELADLEERLREEIADAFAWARSSPPPAPERLLEDVYAPGKTAPCAAEPAPEVERAAALTDGEAEDR